MPKRPTIAMATARRAGRCTAPGGCPLASNPGAAAASKHQAGDATSRNFRNAGLNRPSTNINPMGSSSQRLKTRAGTPRRRTAAIPASGSRAPASSQGPRVSGRVRMGPKRSVRTESTIPAPKPTSTPPLGQCSTRSIAVGSHGRKRATTMRFSTTKRSGDSGRVAAAALLSLRRNRRQPQRQE